MKQVYFLLAVLFFGTLYLQAQPGSVQNAAIPKDAQVDVTVTDFNKVQLPHESLFSGVKPMAGNTRALPMIMENFLYGCRQAISMIFIYLGLKILPAMMCWISLLPWGMPIIRNHLL